MLRDSDRMRWCDRISIATLLSLTLVMAGCSAGGIGSPATTASDPGSPSASSSSPSFGEKFSNFFSGSSAKSPQAVANAPTDVNCPTIDIRQGASTLTVGPTGEKSTMSLKYQGTFVRAARECAVVGGQIVMKVGVEGRIVLGPAGGPGQVDVPLRIAVVHETPGGMKPIATRFVRIPVVIAASNENPTFTHIEEGLSFPMPSAAELDDYIVYIGFDPLSAEAQDKQKPKPKSKPNPKAKPTAGTG